MCYWHFLIITCMRFELVTWTTAGSLIACSLSTIRRYRLQLFIAYVMIVVNIKDCVLSSWTRSIFLIFDSSFLKKILNHTNKNEQFELIRKLCYSIIWLVLFSLKYHWLILFYISWRNHRPGQTSFFKTI